MIGELSHLDTWTAIGTVVSAFAAALAALFAFLAARASSRQFYQSSRAKIVASLIYEKQNLFLELRNFGGIAEEVHIVGLTKDMHRELPKLATSAEIRSGIPYVEPNGIHRILAAENMDTLNLVLHSAQTIFFNQTGPHTFEPRPIFLTLEYIDWISRKKAHEKCRLVFDERLVEEFRRRQTAN